MLHLILAACSALGGTFADQGAVELGTIDRALLSADVQKNDWMVYYRTFPNPYPYTNWAIPNSTLSGPAGPPDAAFPNYPDDNVSSRRKSPSR